MSPRTKLQVHTCIIFLKSLGSWGSSKGYPPTNITYKVTPHDHTSAICDIRQTSMLVTKHTTWNKNKRWYRSKTCTSRRYHSNLKYTQHTIIVKFILFFPIFKLGNFWMLYAFMVQIRKLFLQIASTKHVRNDCPLLFLFSNWSCVGIFTLLIGDSYQNTSIFHKHTLTHRNLELVGIWILNFETPRNIFETAHNI